MILHSDPNAVVSNLFEISGNANSSNEDAYCRLSALAAFLVQCARDNRNDFFPALFERIEDYLIFGTREVQDLMIVGMLEELKNASLRENIDWTIFEEWLGPESHVAWRWLEKRWKGKHSLAAAVKKREE